jgi:hypothetical protein
MKKAGKAFQRNILIVCEGENTEPLYFHFLRTAALEVGIWQNIEIKPKPKIDDDDQPSEPSPHKTRRKKRQLVEAEVDEADDTEIQHEWHKTPARFVKEARDGLRDGSFEEAWAVFDRNGHPAHKQAFGLAKEMLNGKTVKIAFSSIAFEVWILLHFERNDTVFTKSACKIDHKHYMDCGTGNHPDDCWGCRCAQGFLRTKKYIEGSTKNLSDKKLPLALQNLIDESLRKTACENAAWLRHIVQHDDKEPFEVNPFTDVDFLVKRLFGEDDETTLWGNLGEECAVEDLLVLVKIEDSHLSINILNQGSLTRLANGVDIIFVIRIQSEKIVLVPEQAKENQLPPGERKTWLYLLPDRNQDKAIIELISRKKQLLIEF